MWENKLWENSRVVVAGKRLQTESFLETLQNKPVGCEETFLQIFLINHVEQFSGPTCCGSSGNHGVKVPVVDDVLSSREQEIYPTTSIDENCLEFEFQTDRNYYVDSRQTYLAVKLKVAKYRCYETYNTREKKEHKEEARTVDEATAEDEVEAPAPLVTDVNNNLQSLFTNVELLINNQQFYNTNGLFAHKSYNSNNFEGAVRENKGVLALRGVRLWRNSF